MKPDCKLLINYSASRGRAPWVFCRDDQLDSDFQSRRAALEQAGAVIYPIPLLATGGSTMVWCFYQLISYLILGQLSLQALLHTLQSQGITSLMVEGGQRVISSFLSADPASVDVVIITIAPMFVGQAGVEAIISDNKVFVSWFFRTANLRALSDSLVGAYRIGELRQRYGHGLPSVKTVALCLKACVDKN